VCQSRDDISFLFFVVSVTGIWGLLALRLADDSIIPFNYVSYADQLQVFLYRHKYCDLLLAKYYL